MKTLTIIVLLISTTVFAQVTEWSQLNRKYKVDNSKQSFCFDNNNETISSNNNLQVQPASVTKLYVTYWALKRLSKSHQFRTTLYISENKIHIEGSKDPFFVNENLYAIISKLNELGIESVDTITYDENFYFNWKRENLNSTLKSIFNTRSWSQSKKKEFKSIVSKINKQDNIKINTNLRFQVNSISRSNTRPIKQSTELNYYSSPLYMQLKQMNIYSNNFMAQAYFDMLGGIKPFHIFMYKNLNVFEKDLMFDNGAGFRYNYTTCNTTIKLLKKLNEESKAQELKLTDFISMPSVDQGTLRNRLNTEYTFKKIVAKTGTLRDTSTLAGMIKVNENEYIYFGVFNNTSDPRGVRKMQDEFLNMYLSKYENAVDFDYEEFQYNPLTGAKIK